MTVWRAAGYRGKEAIRKGACSQDEGGKGNGTTGGDITKESEEEMQIEALKGPTRLRNIM